jgi:uncharacterized membrane protein HdeD (DUF308 family)
MMGDSIINELISGALVMGYLIATVFFLKFYKSSRDRLFALFAAAFGILSVQRVALALTTRTAEDTVLIYVIRLVAFLIILYAIIDKNMQAKKT